MEAANASRAWRSERPDIEFSYILANCLIREAIIVPSRVYARRKSGMSSDSTVIYPGDGIMGGNAFAPGPEVLVDGCVLTHGFLIFRLRQYSQGSDSDSYTHWFLIAVANLKFTLIRALRQASHFTAPFLPYML